MSLLETYSKHILESLFIEDLKNGEIPSQEELALRYTEYAKTNNLDVPFIASLVSTIEPGEVSSAAQIEEVSSLFSKDVSLLTKEIYLIFEKNIRLYSRWRNEFERLYSLGKEVERRIDNLLLAEEDTLGFFAFVSDSFDNLSNVNTAETTALVDISSNSVSLNSKNEFGTPNVKTLDLQHIRDEDTSFQLLEKKPGVSLRVTKGSKLSNVFKQDNTTYVAIVNSKNKGPISCEIRVNISKTLKKMTRISLAIDGNIGTSGSTVTPLYSQDGYNWKLFPCSAPTKNLANKVFWTFPEVEVSSVKFIFSKTTPDSSSNDYVFSFENIKFYSSSFVENNEDILLTSSLSALNNQNEPISFSSVLLEACEEIPDTTELEYWVCVSPDNESWTQWQSIVPSSRETKFAPKIINFGGMNYITNEDENTALLDSSTSDALARYKLVDKDSLTQIDSLPLKEGNFAFLNALVKVDDPNLINQISDSIIVWRNFRYKELLDYPDLETVRTIKRGWSFDGGQYTCYFEILKDEGKVFDFGNSSCEIDGKKTTGKVTVPVGIHKFVTPLENWYDFSTEFNNPSSEEELKKIDPLYPFNHKALIEGIYYSLYFKGEQKYTGVKRSASSFAKKIGSFDLQYNLTEKEQYNYFSVCPVTIDNVLYLSLFVRIDPSDIDYKNELFQVYWKSSPTESDVYKYVKLKASFWSPNTTLSPILSSYLLKLGV